MVALLFLRVPAKCFPAMPPKWEEKGRAGRPGDRALTVYVHENVKILHIIRSICIQCTLAAFLNSPWGTGR